MGWGGVGGVDIIFWIGLLGGGVGTCEPLPALLGWWWCCWGGGGGETCEPLPALLGWWWCCWGWGGGGETCEPLPALLGWWWCCWGGGGRGDLWATTCLAGVVVVLLGAGAGRLVSHYLPCWGGGGVAGGGGKTCEPLPALLGWWWCCWGAGGRGDLWATTCLAGVVVVLLGGGGRGDLWATTCIAGEGGDLWATTCLAGGGGGGDLWATTCLAGEGGGGLVSLYLHCWGRGGGLVNHYLHCWERGGGGLVNHYLHCWGRGGLVNHYLHCWGRGGGLWATPCIAGEGGGETCEPLPALLRNGAGWEWQASYFTKRCFWGETRWQLLLQMQPVLVSLPALDVVACTWWWCWRCQPRVWRWCSCPACRLSWCSASSQGPPPPAVICPPTSSVRHMTLLRPVYTSFRLHFYFILFFKVLWGKLNSWLNITANSMTRCLG